MADVCIVNKVDSAPEGAVDQVLASVRAHNPKAQVVLAASPIEVEGGGDEIHGKRVLCIEDGPTLTHGDMTFGAAVLAAQEYGAAALVDPRPFAVGSIAETFVKYPKTGTLLPAMGYGDEQTEELRETIARSDAELVLIGTPIDLRRLIDFDRPALRVSYRLQEVGEPTLASIFAERGLISQQASSRASSPPPRPTWRPRLTHVTRRPPADGNREISVRLRTEPVRAPDECPFDYGRTPDSDGRRTKGATDAQVRTGRLGNHRGGRGSGAGRAQPCGQGHGIQSPRGAADRRGSVRGQHGSLRVPQPRQAQHADDRVQLDPGRRPRRGPQLVHVLAQRPLQHQDRPDRGRPGGSHVRVPLQDRYRPALPRQHHAVVHAS